MQELYLVKYHNFIWLTGGILATHENFLCELGNSHFRCRSFEKMFCRKKKLEIYETFLTLLHLFYAVLK